MIEVKPDSTILHMLANHFVHKPLDNSWKGLVVDHEGRDWMAPITDVDRLVTTYILMHRFKRRCYRSQFNIAIALGMSYKLTPMAALKQSREHLMATMRSYSRRSRRHYYSRFELAGVDPRDYRWPQYLSHNYVFPQNIEVSVHTVTALHEIITKWLKANMA